jgi:hypothetical protein
MKTQCPHNNLTFFYKNLAGNSVYSCECKKLIIKKPNDERLYTLNEKVQLIEI